MSNEIIVKENEPLKKIVDFFGDSGVLTYFSEQLGYAPDYLQREALSFAHKITLHDMNETKEERKFKSASAISKRQCFMSILQLGLTTDARDLYYLYNDKGTMTFDVSYKGLIYIAECNGLNVKGGLIFKGDEFESNETSEGDTYTIKRKNPFARKVTDLVGCYVYVISDKEKTLFTFSFEELEKSKQASQRKMFGKESPAWKDYPLDMYLKCGIKKGVKAAINKIRLNDSQKQAIESLFDEDYSDNQPQYVQSEKTADLSCETINEDDKKSKFDELRKQFDIREQDDE